MGDSQPLKYMFLLLPVVLFVDLDWLKGPRFGPALSNNGTPIIKHTIIK